MIWGDTRAAKQWAEPFSASVRVSESGDELLGYQIMCGDALRGWEKCLTKRTRSSNHSDAILSGVLALFILVETVLWMTAKPRRVSTPTRVTVEKSP
jgi:hypothetical protein